MKPRASWPDNPVFIEIGVQDAVLAQGLRAAGYDKYLGVSGSSARIARMQAAHPDAAQQFVCVRRPRLVLYNNADVLVLSGLRQFFVWKYRSVRHARCVAWRCGLGPMALLALLGCMFHMLSKRYSRPRLVTLRTPQGAKRRLLVSRVLKRKLCHRGALHFVPHALGIQGLFRQFDAAGVRYVVLRWFDELPAIKDTEDLDLLIADESLAAALEIMRSQPGVQATDVYSETGLARSDYCGTPYYPADVAARVLLLQPARHMDLCNVPNPWSHFHSLAYHAVYHKGLKSGLPTGVSGLETRRQPGHDYAGVLRSMADRLGIDVEITLADLHAYLQQSGWGPSPEMLARLSAACRGNRWLRLLAGRLSPHVHDQGLAVFVLRERAVQHGFRDKMIAMIAEAGFEILAAKDLSAPEVQFAAARTRGGTWGTGRYELAAGPPAVAVIVYDPQPLAPNRRQRRRFPQRTNARIFVKEAIRDAVLALLPADQGCNALHSSDHAAEAWHLIEVLAPEYLAEIRAAIDDRQREPVLTLTGPQAASPATPLRRAA